MRRRVRDAIVIAVVTVALAEAGLRALPLIVGDPLKSLIVEARRIALSNLRTHGGTRVLLPPVIDADIAVIGDSFPFGTYVRASDTFASVIARDTGRAVINLAVGSQDPTRYQRMVELALTYRPELLFYCVFANDFVYEGDIVPRKLDGSVPFGGRPEDRSLYVDRLTLRDRAETTWKSLTDLSTLNLLRKLLQSESRFHSVPWRQGNLSYQFAPIEYWDPMLDWRTPAVQRATAINAALIEQAAAFAGAHGMQLVVVLLPSKEIVHGPMVGAAIFRDSHQQTYRELAKQLREKDIKVVDLTEPLRAQAERGVQLFHTIDGHLNETGHRAVAAELDQQVVDHRPGDRQ